ncbi:MAG: SRPBCC family protein [Anaerolineae bacterium]
MSFFGYPFDDPNPLRAAGARLAAMTERGSAPRVVVPDDGDGQSGGRNLGRWALAAGGVAVAAYMIYRRQRRQGGEEEDAPSVYETVTIDRPQEELYSVWRNFENLPKFMPFLESVTVLDNTHSHWKVKGPVGTKVEWDAQIVEENEPNVIRWQSTDKASVPNSGEVRFQPAPAGRGTEVHVDMEYHPPAGKIGAAFTNLFKNDPDKQVFTALWRFKQLMETGEIATTEGQPHGSRSTVEKAADAVTSG